MSRPDKTTGEHGPHGPLASRSPVCAAADESVRPQGRHVTIKDVAASAGVSPMTVSNVINGKHQFVGEKTRKTVEREIERLQYRVQQSGRSLRVAQRNSVGLIFVDESPSFLTDHFNAHIAAGLSNVLGRADYTMTVQGIFGTALSRSAIIRKFAVDGFCVVLSGTSEARGGMIRELLRLGQPLVLIQEPSGPLEGDACIVRQDDAGGGRLIADHLVARRIRHLLVIAPSQEWPAVNERIRGLRAGIEAASGAMRLDLIQAETEEFDSAQSAVAAYLKNEPLPDAIVGANDRLAIAAMSLLQSRNIAVPGRVRVVGFNGFEARRYATPLITTVISSAYRMGESAGELLLARFGTGRFPVSETVLPVHFDLGETT